MIEPQKIALALHGGAGTILKQHLTDELENDYRSGLQNALECGWEILNSGGNALDAVEATVGELEDNPLFNAGRGAVFTHEGVNEMDACIMNGENLQAGAIAFVKNVKNPIKLARLVMEKTEHIFLAGAGAIEFAKQMNVEFADDAYFYTEYRHEQLQQARESDVVQLDHAARTDEQKSKPIGTVGAVACDSAGNLAAATSTGGMTNKKFGRIGDTPIVGAGNYADNRTCAVSCTGHGEFFMQTLAAYDVAARMKYQNSSLDAAASAVVENLRKIGGEGGLIAVDRFGNIALPFNSDGMYRAYITSDIQLKVEIHR